jgi:hypothetical protein
MNTNKAYDNLIAQRNERLQLEARDNLKIIVKEIKKLVGRERCIEYLTSIEGLDFIAADKKLTAVLATLKQETTALPKGE